MKVTNGWNNILSGQMYEIDKLIGVSTECSIKKSCLPSDYHTARTAR